MDSHCPTIVRRSGYRRACHRIYDKLDHAPRRTEIRPTPQWEVARPAVRSSRLSLRPIPGYVEECDMEDKSTSDRPRDDVKASHNDSEPDAVTTKPQSITADQLQAAARV